MKNFIKNAQTSVKSTFTKENLKQAAVKATCETLGTAHFIAQGAADLIKEVEVRAVCAIDKGNNPAKVRRVRNVIYIKNRAKVGIAAYTALAKLEQAKAKWRDSVSRVEKLVEPDQDAQSPITDALVQ